MLLTNDHPGLMAHWHPVARAGSPGTVTGATLFGRRYVVAQLDAGTLVSLDECPHRGARLSLGTVAATGDRGESCLQCPYHGWSFDKAGTCVDIPALGSSPIPSRAALAAVPAHTALGLVWIRGDHGHEGFDPIVVPEWEAPGIEAAWLPDVVIGCSAGQFIDNFCDFAHFPFVHAGTFGADEDHEVGDLDVQSDGEDSLLLTYRHQVANREDPLVETGDHPLLQPREMQASVRSPFSARLRIVLPLTGVENTVLVVASPTDADRTTLFTVLLRNDLDGDATRTAHAVDYELSVLAEDLRIIEDLADRGLRLDLPSQIHTRADRLTVEYRNLLRRTIA